MHFLDDSLLPENQQKLVIQVAPYGPQSQSEWLNVPPASVSCSR